MSQSRRYAANAPTTSSSDRLDSAFLIVLALVAAFVVVIALPRVLGSGIDEDTFTFPPIEISRAELARERQARAPTALAEGVAEDVDKLITLVQRLNLRQFPDHQPQSSDDAPLDPNQARLRSVLLANNVLTQSKLEGFVSTGKPLFNACSTGLRELLEDLAAGKISAEEALTSPDPETYEAYRANCGNLLQVLVERKLIDPSTGQWTSPVAPIVFDVLQRYRWASLVGDKRPPHMQLTPAENEILWRWRIEDPHAYTMAERREYLQRASQALPGYDTLLAGALLDASEGKWDQVEQAYEELVARDPENPKHQARLEWLRARDAR